MLTRNHVQKPAPMIIIYQLFTFQFKSLQSNSLLLNPHFKFLTNEKWSFLFINEMTLFFYILKCVIVIRIQTLNFIILLSSLKSSIYHFTSQFIYLFWNRHFFSFQVRIYHNLVVYIYIISKKKKRED